jgi:hypothetical protein
MVYTTIAWYRNVQTGGVLTDLNVVKDPHISQTDTRYVIPEAVRHLAGVFAASANITECHLETPSLRRVAPLCVSPLNAGSAKPVSPVRFMDMFDAPLPLTPNEQILCKAAGSETAATDFIVIAFLASGRSEPVGGPYYTIKATASSTLQPWQWTPVTPTFETSLPVGRYRIIGLRAQSPNLIAARIVVPGQPWRPGVIGVNAVTDKEADRFRFGRNGVLAEFDTAEGFQIECLAAAADTSQVFWLDLVPVAGGG